ncbi:flagellar filament capping protein FliD [Ferrimonas pelagia]|uniref:Flagellar hook-associated protein 2 n=1 Tax=Ferrimonas pelagia TaxID=1177826 RepID=A0ABP9EFA5_9GAMM
MISSGFDPAQMALMLMQVERAPKDQLYALQTQQYEAQKAAYSALETKLKSFSDSMSSITDDAFSKKGIEISDEDMANVTAGTDAANGDYAFFVKQLASAHQIAWEFDEDGALPEGSYDIQLGDGEVFTIDIGPETTLEEVRDQINSSEELGIQATLVRSDGKVNLVLTSEETGEDNLISVKRDGELISDPDVAGSTVKVMSEAQNAILLMGESNPIEIQSASNTIDNAIDGLTIELKKTHEFNGDQPVGGPLRISVGQDKEAVTESVQSFIDDYNSLIDEIAKQTFGKSIDGDEDDAVGVLSGDAALRGLSQRLRTELYNGSSDGLHLSDLGIEIDREGKLKLNSSDFHEALDTHGNKVQEFFSEEGGLFDRIDNAIGNLTENDGYLKSRQNSMDQNIRRVEDRVEQHDMRMEQTYQRYLSQFVRVEQLTLQMQQSSMFFY